MILLGAGLLCIGVPLTLTVAVWGSRSGLSANDPFANWNAYWADRTQADYGASFLLSLAPLLAGVIMIIVGNFRADTLVDAEFVSSRENW